MPTTLEFHGPQEFDMIRAILRLVLLLIGAATLTGCSSWNLGPWGGPAYTLEMDKVGTGQPAVIPRNDAFYQDGESMDCRSRH
jgi:hypothetical protein